MASRTFKIGRTQDNDFVIPAPVISAHHAEITPLENDRYRIVDNNSGNGTFVNKIRIVCCDVGYDDIIEFAVKNNSPGVPFDLKKYFPKKLVFTKEFLKLEKVYEDFLNEKRRISKAKNKRMMTLRIGASLGVGLLAFGVMYALGDQVDPSVRMLVSPLMIAVTMGVSMLAINGDDSEMKKLEEWFIRSYVCPNPKCRQPLNGPFLTNKLRRQCPFCKAKWYDGDNK